MKRGDVMSNRIAALGAACFAAVLTTACSPTALETRVQRLEDEAAIVRLQNVYGYYVDKRLWDQVVALFADNAAVEISHRGAYTGKAGVRRLFLESWGKGSIGLARGQLFTHMMMQPVIDVSADGQHAWGRFRTFAQVGQVGPGATGVSWVEGVYENEFTREGGVWKYSKMRFWPTYYVPESEGFMGTLRPNIESDAKLPPDKAPSDDAGVLPDVYYPPFHYPNPVTGRSVDVAALNARALAETTTVKRWTGTEPVFEGQKKPE
jgi:hypothetical protein